MERWYVGISAFAGFVVPIAPAALDHFGSDPILSVWYVQKSATELTSSWIQASKTPTIRPWKPFLPL